MQINNVPFTDKKSHDKNKKHIEAQNAATMWIM